MTAELKVRIPPHPKTGMGTGKDKKIWSEDIRRLFAEENAIFSTLKMKKKNGIQVKTWGHSSRKKKNSKKKLYYQTTQINL